MKALFIGDIVGKIGRKTIAKIVPEIVKKEKIDLVIANCENIAHGKGITEATIKEALDSQIDILTSGNHIWAKKDYELVLSKYPVLRPANFPTKLGEGVKLIEVGTKKVLVINLLGRVFMKESLDDPFKKFDEILEEYKGKFDLAIVDFHSEASSEARAFGLYVDGKVSAVFGTHRHIMTADAQILGQGTFYITDLGMVGATPSVLGIDKDEVIKSYLTGMPFKHEIPEDGKAEFNALIIDFSKDPYKFKQSREIISID